MVNPKIESTVDAQRLSQMTDRWAPYHMSVIGPTSVDLALSPEACHHKGYSAPGAGEADILLVTNYEMGNALYKSALVFAGCTSAGLVVGGKAPIILTSRSDSARSKLSSLALGSVISQNNVDLSVPGLL